MNVFLLMTFPFAYFLAFVVFVLCLLTMCLCQTQLGGSCPCVMSYSERGIANMRYCCQSFVYKPENLRNPFVCFLTESIVCIESCVDTCHVCDSMAVMTLPAQG